MHFFNIQIKKKKKRLTYTDLPNVQAKQTFIFFRPNLFFCAYIGLHWPMGVGAGGSRPSKQMENIRKYVVFMH